MRLAVIAISHVIDQLLGILGITAESGIEVFSVVYEVINKLWSSNEVRAFIFDTTASNTGKFNVACSLLERKTECNTLFLGYRQHINEIILSIVFTKLYICPISIQDISLFKTFQKWDTIKKYS